MSKNFIPYGRQSIDASDVRAVTRVLRSDRLTQGPAVERFEREFADSCGAPYAVAVANGTAGLHLACLAAGFGPGDEVLTSPMTFVATANAVLYAGAKPLFADIDERTLGIDPEFARKSRGKKVRGMVSVDFAGQPWRTAAKNGLEPSKDFFVIEDACHALGASVGKDKLGSGRHADMTVFSFHPVKHITTGEGGMVTTRRRDLYEKLKLLRTHGIEKDPARFTGRGERGPWSYEMQALGFNYRITDIQCALGSSQLKKLGRFVEKRRRIAAYYDRRFCRLPGVRTPERIHGTASSYHLYVLRIDFKRLGRMRAEFMRALASRGIGTQVHYIPVTEQPYYRAMGYKTPPVCREYYEQALSIPMYPDLKPAEMARVADEIERLVS